MGNNKIETFGDSNEKDGIAPGTDWEKVSKNLKNIDVNGVMNELDQNDLAKNIDNDWNSKFA